MICQELEQKKENDTMGWGFSTYPTATWFRCSIYQDDADNWRINVVLDSSCSLPKIVGTDNAMLHEVVDEIEQEELRFLIAVYMDKIEDDLCKWEYPFVYVTGYYYPGYYDNGNVEVVSSTSLRLLQMMRDGEY